MTRMLSIILFLLAVHTTLADSITLRGSVRMPADGTALTLSDVAVLEGDEALRFADLEVQPAHELIEAIELDVHTIQRQLDDEGANWANVALSGGMVVVRPRVTKPLVASMNTTAVPIERLSTVLNATDTTSGETFRTLEAWSGVGEVEAKIAAMVATAWGDEAPLVQISIDRTSLASMASQSTLASVESRGNVRGADWFDVQVRTTRGTDRLRPTRAALVRVDVRIRTNTSIAAERLPSKRTLRIDDLKRGMSMLKPTDAARSLEPSYFVGRRLRRVVEAGAPVLGEALEPEIVVDRNARVRVLMNGPFQLSGTDAVALERGAVGERIKCRWRASDEPFTALITAPGEVRVGS